MKNIQILLIAIVILAGTYMSDDAYGWGFYPAASYDPNLPTVLLVGDSIMAGYDGPVMTALAGVANVDRWSTGNYISALDFHAEMDEVLRSHGPYDVIHFNDMGLHAWPPERMQNDVYDYYLKLYVEHYIAYCPNTNLLWASTTPMTVEGDPTTLDPVNNPNLVYRNGRADIIMGNYGNSTNDLYGLVVPDYLNSSYKLTDQFHWTASGYDLMANQIVPLIKQELANPRSRENVFYVAADGDDNNPGTLAAPFATLEKAKLTMRAANKPTVSLIYLRKGTYTVDPNFVLDVQDAGTVDKPVIWRAFPQESVSLICTQPNDVVAAGVTGIEWNLAVESKPVILSQPEPSFVFSGDSAEFSIVATDPSEAGMNYQWYGPDGEIGTNSPTLGIPNAQLANEGNYYCVMTNSNGSTTSGSALLTIKRMIGNWLLGQWPGDASFVDSIAFFEDKSGHGNDADAFNGPAFVEGPYGLSALQFNGSNQYVEVSINDVLNKYKNAFTVALWVRDDGAASWARIFNYGYYSINDQDFARLDLCRNNSASSTFAARNGDLTGSTFVTASMPLNSWNHFVVVYVNDALYLYKNGMLVSEPIPASGQLRDVIDEPIVMAAKIKVDSNGVAEDPSSFFKGTLCDIRVYNYGLDISEVEAMYVDILGEPVCFRRPASDISGPAGVPDCVVDIYDLLALLSEWLQN